MSGGSLRRGDTKSCGCYNRELRQLAWPRGTSSRLWKGGRSLRKDGYVTIYTGERFHQYEHVKVMEDHLGRKLYPEETVHHRNGVRSDNSIGNLELWSKSHPSGQRVTDKVAWAEEILKLYAPEKLK